MCTVYFTVYTQAHNVRIGTRGKGRAPQTLWWGNRVLEGTVTITITINSTNAIKADFS